MNDAPLVSVVTPVYNGADYLDECIQSVLQQTYTNWEYIIFDNVSTDASADIAERYAAVDHRIRVVRAHQFVGANDNFNRALRSISPRSRYCKTIHADDWLFPQCLEQMISVAEKQPSIGVVSAFVLLGTEVALGGVLPYQRSILSGAEVIRRELLHKQWLLLSPSSFLMRADYIRTRDHFYDTRVWHADTDAAYRVLLTADFGFVHQVLTFARVQPLALQQFSNRVWTFMPRDGRLLLRYGPKVMDRAQYRAAIRRWLTQYGVWLAKQAVKPSRRGQDEFYEFHRREIKYMIGEASSDAEVRTALLLFRLLLQHSSKANGQRRDRAATEALGSATASSQ
jgi:glycosyltransferase involved in cell wall biosynthesis